MADLSPYPDATGDIGDDTGAALDRGSPPRTPTWVKLFGIIALALVALVVIMMLNGGGPGGSHGPGRHLPSGDPGIQTPLAGVTQSSDVGGHTPPVQQP